MHCVLVRGIWYQSWAVELWTVVPAYPNRYTLIVYSQLYDTSQTSLIKYLREDTNRCKRKLLYVQLFCLREFSIKSRNRLLILVLTVLSLLCLPLLSHHQPDRCDGNIGRDTVAYHTAWHHSWLEIKNATNTSCNPVIYSILQMPTDFTFHDFLIYASESHSSPLPSFLETIHGWFQNGRKSCCESRCRRPASPIFCAWCEIFLTT